MLPVILPDAVCASLRAQLHANPGASISVDLEAQKVTGPDGALHSFDIDANAKERLLKGLDDIGLVMQYSKDIEAFEQRHAAAMPWLT
jgi:3-isopropylmalate/(R)-2-methylmalate dehydratase small subunit